jgi:hypothetical protein
MYLEYNLHNMLSVKRVYFTVACLAISAREAQQTYMSVSSVAHVRKLRGEECQKGTSLNSHRYASHVQGLFWVEH